MNERLGALSLALRQTDEPHRDTRRGAEGDKGRAKLQEFSLSSSGGEDGGEEALFSEAEIVCFSPVS